MIVQSAHCQDPARETETAPHDPEDLFSLLQDEEAAEARLEHLNDLMEDPVDLNTATASELLAVPGFEGEIVSGILRFRRENRIRALKDLLEIAGVSAAVLSRASPFVTVKASDTQGPATVLSGAVRSRAEAYLYIYPDESGQFAGNRWKISHRLLLGRSREAAEGGDWHISAGLLAEKDQGEARLADHVGGFLQLRLEGAGMELILGDFALDAAYGLAFGSRGGAMKSSDVLGPSRWKSLSVRPSVSSTEPSHLRGIALNYRGDRCEAAAVYSNRGVHARLDDEFSAVTSIYEGGLFRTPAEEALRFRTRERLVAARGVIRLADGLSVGGRASESLYLHPLRLSSFAGKAFRRFSLVALDGSVSIRRLTAGFELAQDQAGRSALNLAFRSRISRDLEALVFVRSASGGFASFHGYPFADRAGAPGGESGVYLGVRWKVLPGLRGSLFSDHFTTSTGSVGGLRSSGRDFLVNLEAVLDKSLRLMLQARERMATGGIEATDERTRRVYGAGDRSTWSLRLSLEYSPTATLRLKSRYEIKEVRPGTAGNGETGLSMYQDIRWRPVSWFSLEVRVTAFDTESYAARLYAWEQGVRGAMGQVLLYGAGIRWYCFVRCSLGKSFVAEMKYSETDRAVADETRNRPSLRRMARRHLSAQIEFQY
jgi:hypothetical protein